MPSYRHNTAINVAKSTLVTLFTCTSSFAKEQEGSFVIVNDVLFGSIMEMAAPKVANATVVGEIC